MAKFDLRTYARTGAEARVAELEEELRGIYRVFPELARRRQGPSPASDTVAPTRARRRKRRTMSPEQRKAVSERMAKYWAQRRAAKGAKKR